MGQGEIGPGPSLLFFCTYFEFLWRFMILGFVSSNKSVPIVSQPTFGFHFLKFSLGEEKQQGRTLARGTDLFEFVT